MIEPVKALILSCLISSSVFADDDWDHYRGYGDHHHHRHHHCLPAPPIYYERDIVYVPERIVEYVPVPQHYYSAPPPPVSYGYYDQRSSQGLVGGVLGSAMGYQMGRGDPLAAGIGAATGAWFGNGMGR
ncbi:MAG: hypothetical protein M0R33_02445 [Methylomonas sp.]|uniref:hypothetical protein n=1 Tax=Methylomonas sp. TaxID=418 RepID=UPI0025EF9C10|nr:hypothetical protein [Methylomonas sp.]MCK9605290.1 hypothetical protein [Methylomonas sp.]